MSYRARGGGTVGTRSPFWRVTRQLVGLVEGDQAVARDGWESLIAWSNLAKIAPAAGGNPSAKLYASQYEACVAALRQELAELDPGVVLLIAGESWYHDVMRSLGIGLRQRPGATYVRHIAKEASRMWLCTERPEHHPEAAFVAELVAAHGAVSAS